MIPKAELHVHLEGTMPPSLVRQIAARNQLHVSEAIMGPNDTFLWQDFLHFLKVYDEASMVLRNRQDYRDMTYDYLARSAKQGGIYTEMMISPDHAALCGVSYEDHLAGAIEGIEDAKTEFGIEGRLIITGVRHFGPDKVLEVALKARAHPHPYVVGFGLGGDEAGFPGKLFAKAYDVAHEAGLACTVHAGEFDGPQSVWDALNYLPVDRIGHGVRSIEDPALVEELAKRGTTLEICPGSNIALGVYPNFAAHPFLKLRAAGCNVTLSSDDPPYFGTTLEQEYKTAKEHFGLSDDALREVTKISLRNSFADEKTKERLLKSVD